MKEERFNVLLEQYITDMISRRDRQEFLSLLKDSYYKGLLDKAMEEEWNRAEFEDEKNDEIGQLIERNVMDKIRETREKRDRRGSVVWIRKAAAIAAVLLLIAGGYYFMATRDVSSENRELAGRNLGNKSKVGSNKALLTLGDGHQIALDSAKGGTIAQQGGAKLEKKSDGVLAYEAVGKSRELLFNTVTTQKGGQYHVKLVDGTEVWLDAASSIRFPTTFEGDERKVEITGEGYFEVARKAKKPFRVIVQGMQVEVVGTHFNINAYDNEKLWKTTLVQGKIKISKGKAVAILSPGEQLRLSALGGLSIVKGVDIEEALAWKDGYFKFKNADVGTIMRQVERWYDVEVIYQGAKPKGHYKGEISRDEVPADVVRILNAAGIECKIEGKKIIVR